MDDLVADDLVVDDLVVDDLVVDEPIKDIEDLVNVEDISYSRFGKQPNLKTLINVSESDKIKSIKNSVLGLSCSRRTDIPWGYLDQYMKLLNDGFMYVPNPVSGKLNPVYLKPYDFKTKKGIIFISWWSKNYSKWIKAYQNNSDFFDQWSVHLFNFTVNSENEDLEPNTIPLNDRLDQIKWICDMFGPYSLNIRFDPIVIYKKKDGKIYNNLSDFEKIIEFIANIGIKHIVFSFCLYNGNVSKNMIKNGLTPINISILEQKKIVDQLLLTSFKYGVKLKACCMTPLVGYGKDQWKVESSKCIDGAIVQMILDKKSIPIKLKQQKDKGQRVECNCISTRDIGYYQSCPHGCRYCYANPSLLNVKKN